MTRYTWDKDKHTLDAKSEQQTIAWESDGHNGGDMEFGADGMLYVTSGDGTSDSDTNMRGQDLTHLTAKVLRIDVDRPDPELVKAGHHYRVPDDNPFVGQAGIVPETWAYGLRNPWLTGHKWFFSVPVSDGFFTLARADAGVSCFFVPGFLPDGSRNAIRIQRLKDKCGNRSNASSEIEYHDALAWLVGEEGHGIREILSHAHLTRLDFAIGSAGLMRQALTLALNHAQSRRGFGLSLADQPMMTNILADLAIDSEASTLMAFRVARAVDAMESSEAGAPSRSRRHAARQVLELQAGAGLRRRGARMPRRQRLHRGEPDGAPLSRGAAQRHLGRHQQHDVHGRAAQPAPRPGNVRGLHGRGDARQGRRPPPRPLARQAGLRDRPPAQRRRPRPPPVQQHGVRAAGERAARARLARRVRDLLPVPPAGRLGLRVRHARQLRPS